RLFIELSAAGQAMSGQDAIVWQRPELLDRRTPLAEASLAEKEVCVRVDEVLRDDDALVRESDDERILGLSALQGAELHSDAVVHLYSFGDDVLGASCFSGDAVAVLLVLFPGDAVADLFDAGLDRGETVDGCVDHRGSE